LRNLVETVRAATNIRRALAWPRYHKELVERRRAPAQTVQIVDAAGNRNVLAKRPVKPPANRHAAAWPRYHKGNSLVGLGASIEAVDDTGNNALISAAVGDHRAVGEWLIAAGTNPADTNDVGKDAGCIIRRERNSTWTLSECPIIATLPAIIWAVGN